MTSLTKRDRKDRANSKKNWYLLYQEDAIGKRKDELVGYVTEKEEAKAYVRDRENSYYRKIPREDFLKMSISIEPASIFEDSTRKTIVLSEEEFIYYETMLSQSIDDWMRGIQMIIETLPAFEFPKKLLGECSDMLKDLKLIYDYMYEYGGDIYEIFEAYELVELFYLTEVKGYDNMKVYNSKLEYLDEVIREIKRNS